MHTEAEAKTKWCPMARLGGGGIHSTRNRPFRIDEGKHVNCITTDCMMWRTAKPFRKKFFVSYNGKPEEEWNWDPTNHKGYEGASVRIVEPEAYGYCGLAGKADPA